MAEEKKEPWMTHMAPTVILAVIFLQVAILLNSIAGLMKAKRV